MAKRWADQLVPSPPQVMALLADPLQHLLVQPVKSASLLNSPGGGLGQKDESGHLRLSRANNQPSLFHPHFKLSS